MILFELDRIGEDCSFRWHGSTFNVRGGEHAVDTDHCELFG